MFKTILHAAIAAITAAMQMAVQAAPVIYFGENQSPASTVSGNPATARANFLSSLAGVSNEGFESFSDLEPPPLDLSFVGSGGSLSATLSGTGVVNTFTGNGRFNTTTGGDKFFDVTGSFQIDFTTAISAFGFYGTDIGDFAGQVTISLTDINDIVTAFTVPNTINGSNGSLLFWGFTDTANSYTRISFGNTAAEVDGFGFDDMVIGDQRQIVNQTPEPGSIALVGLSLAGLAAIRRRTPSILKV